MDKHIKEKKYSIIAAVCYLLLGLYSVLLWYFTQSKYASITFLTVFAWIITFAFCVVVFMRKNNIVAVIVAAVNVLLSIIYIIRGASLLNVMEALSAIALLIIILFASIDSMKENAKITKSIWFLPAAILLFANLISWIRVGFFIHMSIAWRFMLPSLIECAALLFMGLWLKETVSVANKKIPVVDGQQYTTFHPEQFSVNTNSSIIGSADKLMMFKQLLDSGTITQEEFDAKKKQILGL